MKPLRVLVLTHPDNVPPENLETLSAEKRYEIRGECHVKEALETLGHEQRILGVYDDLGILRTTLADYDPHVTFNLIEEFHGVATYDQNIVSYLELLRRPYTGCNPAGLILSRDKSIAKKLLAYHRIPVPRFAVFPKGRKIGAIRGLRFPLFVKSLVEEASLGIAQASLVTNEEKLRERVAFVHEHVGTAAIAEEFIDGRELYVGILGNTKLTVFPTWELLFKKMPEDMPRIATARAKWSRKYQEKHGISSAKATGLPGNLDVEIPRLAKRIYHILKLTGYARLDFRLGADGTPYVLEANPNPDISKDEDFAESAKEAGLDYHALIHRILTLGQSYPAEWKEMAAF